MYPNPKGYGAFSNSRRMIESLPSSDFKFKSATVTFSSDTDIIIFLNNNRLQKTTLMEFFTANKPAEREASAAAAAGRPPLEFDCRDLLYHGLIFPEALES
jgi:hypothetical protein